MKKLLLTASLALLSLSAFAQSSHGTPTTKPEITFTLPINMQTSMPDKNGPKGLKVYSYIDSKNQPNRSVSIMVFKLADQQKGLDMDKASHNFATGILHAYDKQHPSAKNAPVHPVLVGNTKFQMASAISTHLYSNIYSVAGKEYIYAFVFSASNPRSLNKISQMMSTVKIQ